MFAGKDRKQQSATLNSTSKYQGKYPNDFQRTEQPRNSLQILQRSLGNHYLNSFSLTAGQPNGLLIQRTCACGSSCANCMQHKDEQRMLQPKLKIGAPNDKYEQEADRVAEQVMRMPEPNLIARRMVSSLQPGELQRQPFEEIKGEEGRVQAQAIAGSVKPVIQRQGAESEEEEEEDTLQMKPLASQITPLIQRQAESSEEEEEEKTVQTKPLSHQVSPLVQRQVEAGEEEEDEEEAIQAKALPGYVPPVVIDSSKSVQSLHAGDSFGQMAVRPMVTTRIQTKLKIGQLNDKYEQEADRVADRVMRMPEPKPSPATSTQLDSSAVIQRTCSACREKNEEETIQTKLINIQTKPLVQRQTESEEELLQAKTSSGHLPEATSNFNARIQSLRGKGQPLPDSTRAFFEPRFGKNLAKIRIHHDAKATELTEDINARAFTIGQDIFFKSSEYKPSSKNGQRLIAHELTHVFQQTGAIHKDKQTFASQPSTSIQKRSNQKGNSLNKSFQESKKEFHYLNATQVQRAPVGKFLPLDNHESVCSEPPNARRVGIRVHKVIQDKFVKRFKNGRAEFKLPLAAAKACHAQEQTTAKEEISFGSLDLAIVNSKSNPIILRIGEIKPYNVAGISDGIGVLSCYERAVERLSDICTEGEQGILLTYLEGDPRRNEVLNFCKRIRAFPSKAKQKKKSGKKKGTKKVHLEEISPGRKIVRGVGTTTKRQHIPSTEGKRVKVGDPIKWRPGDLTGVDFAPYGKKDIVTINWGGGLIVYGCADKLVKSKDVKKITPDKLEKLQKELKETIGEPKTAKGKASKGETSGKTTIEKEIIAPLKESPVDSSIKSRQKGKRQKSKEEQVKDDPFNYEKWNKSRQKIREKIKKHDDTIAIIKSIGAVEALKPIAPGIRAKLGKKYPKGIGKKAIQISKTVRRIEFWTGKKGEVLGLFRKYFGNAFIAVARAFETIREKFKKPFSGKAEESSKSRGIVGRAIQVVWKVLKQAGKIIIGETLRRLKTTLVNGAKKKIKEIISPDIIAKFEEKVSSIKDYQAKLQKIVGDTEDSFKKFVEPISGLISEHLNKLDAVKQIGEKIHTIVKWVRRAANVIACLSPPAFGCFWILARGVMEWAIAEALDTCSIQKRVLGLVKKLSFIKTLPKTLVNIIAGEIDKLLPKPLKGLFKATDRSKVDVSTNELECNETNDAAIRRYYSISGAYNRMRKDIGEEYMDAWGSVVLWRGIRNDKELTVADIKRIRRTLNKLKEEGLTAQDLKNFAISEFLEKGAEVKRKHRIPLEKLVAVIKEGKKKDFVTIPSEAATGAGVREGEGTGDIGGPGKERGTGGAGGTGGVRQGTSLTATSEITEREATGRFKPTAVSGAICISPTNCESDKDDPVNLTVEFNINGNPVTVTNVKAKVKKRIPSSLRKNTRKVVFHFEVTEDQETERETKKIFLRFRKGRKVRQIIVFEGR